MTQDHQPRTATDELPCEPELVNVYKQYLAFKGDTSDFLTKVNDSQVNWRTEPDHWSIGQCMEHLVLTHEAYAPNLETTIADARKQGVEGRGPFTHGKVMDWVIKNMEPPPRQKLKAPARFRVSDDRLDIERVRRRILEAQDTYCRLVREADGLDLAALKLASPVTRLIRMSLGQSFRFLAAHQRRHLWQARQVAAGRRFPG